MDGLNKLATMKSFMSVEVEECPSAPTAMHSMPDPCKQGAQQLTGDPYKDYPIEWVSANGRRVPMLKALVSSACERNCYYCAFRAARDFRRESFKPEELADTFMMLLRARVVEGMFLSSGVAGGSVRTQDRILDAAEVLRHKYGYEGYLHLKIMPGTEQDQVVRTMQLADRVSVNLEAPTSARLAQLAPEKTFMDELLTRLQWVEKVRQTLPNQKGWRGRWPSSVTQFVVGGVDETDLELLQISAYLYKKLRLKRAYYSGFGPVIDTPLENRPPANPWREHRLYQASFLLRDYGFEYEEFSFAANGSLPLDIDPKLAWAEANLQGSPLEVNRADYQQLLRIPGIGPISARRIIDERRRQPLKQLDDLKTLGVVTKRAAGYILLNGIYPGNQLRLF